MTPEQADLAFALEDVPGIAGVYALAPRPYPDAYDHAVQLHGPHYVDGARRALKTHAAHAKRPPRALIVSFQGGMARSMREGATLLVITDAEREAARGRAAPQQATTTTRRLRAPPPGAPFTALLVDVDDEVHQALRRIFPHDARHLLRRDAEDAAEVALSTPLHIMICGARPALARNSFLRMLANVDVGAANRVVLVAPKADAAHLRWTLERMGRKNIVLSLPIDDALLEREVLRDQPGLAAQLAIAEVTRTEPSPMARRSARCARVLVIDDHPSTEVLHAAHSPHADVDVLLATRSMDAFELLIAKHFDIVLCSAALRSDGGEPFYRTVWQLVPELKACSVLITSGDVPPAGDRSKALPRIVRRPLTGEMIASVARAFMRA